MKSGKKDHLKDGRGPGLDIFLRPYGGGKSVRFRTMSLTNMEATKYCFGLQHFQDRFSPLFISASQLPKSVFLTVTVDQTYRSIRVIV